MVRRCMGSISIGCRCRREQPIGDGRKAAAAAVLPLVVVTTKMVKPINNRGGKEEGLLMVSLSP